MSFIKNISKSEVLTLKEQVSYQKGQVVSKTLAQNDALSVTLFAFDKDEEISTHESGGDAFVTCLDGVGRITIDGRPLDETNLRKWQNTIGYVSQSVFIADSSFMQNVALGCAPDRIDRRRAAQALETAKLKEFIDTLPQGMETPIGECGCRLSGGQRQRLGIARALYKQADILFFDEATSALDNRTEERINRAIEELSKANRELTIIVVAHRESSLDYCDRIITLGEKTA